jgi:hypothetical protein
MSPDRYLAIMDWIGLSDLSYRLCPCTNTMCPALLGMGHMVYLDLISGHVPFCFLFPPLPYCLWNSINLTLADIKYYLNSIPSTALSPQPQDSLDFLTWENLISLLDTQNNHPTT